MGDFSIFVPIRPHIDAGEHNLTETFAHQTFSFLDGTYVTAAPGFSPGKRNDTVAAVIITSFLNF